MLDDKKDYLPALVNISLDDVKSLYHLYGIYNKNTAKFSKRGLLEIFLSTMDRTIIEMVDYTLGGKREKYLCLGH